MTRDSEKKQILTLSNIRNVNITNILHSVLKNKVKTRSELAKENNISVMTVKHIVDDLISGGILIEKTLEGSEVGRKPKALEISESYGNVVCINLTSAEEISFLIYDIYETVLAEQTLTVEASDSYQDNLLRVTEQIKERLGELGKTTVGIAVFVPSAFYEDVDLVNYDLIPDFKDLHMKAFFSKAFGNDNVLVLHDVIPAAWSEYESSDEPDGSQFYFYGGYGVGGFFINQGSAVMGAELMAGEVGKMLLETGDAAKPYQTFEDIISVSALNKRLKQMGCKKRFKEVIRDYDNQEPEIQEMVEAVLLTISRILYNLLWVYNPGSIVIDSCYQEYSQMIIERIEQFIASMESEAIPIRVRVRQARYDEYHMMRGCFHMARESWVDRLADS